MPETSLSLTPRQARFVAEYLVDLNATAAYKRAGYRGTGRTAENNASRLLGVAGVQEAIAAARQEQQQRTGLTADWVLAGLRREAEDCTDTGSASARVAAYRLIGQHLGMFRDDVNINVTVPFKAYAGFDPDSV